MTPTWVLYTVSFFTNAIILIFEITGGRLLAPYLGTSVEVWSGLIGIVLGGMALGYWLGGKLGDKNASPKMISVFLFAAGATALIAWGMRDVVPTLFTISGLSITVGALLIGTILFMPTVILLAIVSPLVAKNLISTLEKSAHTVGTINAVGTMGSILGAVVTGIFLVPFFGVSTIFLGLAIAMLLLALLVDRSHIRASILFLVFAIVLSFFLNTLPTRAEVTLADVSTAYNRIWVDARMYGEFPIRTVAMDPLGTQCAMLINPDGSVDESRLVFPYLAAFDVVLREGIGNLEAPRALFLGGCNYSHPRAFLLGSPDASADVVEIDPGMTKVAKEYFDFEPEKFPSLSIYHEDARIFLNQNHEPYDIIFMDTFGSASTIPFHLTTKELFERARLHLKENGILVINVIGALEGANARFPASLLKTVQAVFPNASLYAYADSPELLQNILITASPTKEFGDFIVHPSLPTVVLRKTKIAPESVDAFLLTDDYAPVEYLVGSYH